MLWIYRLQNRIALTAIESKVLLVIVAIFLTGMAGSYIENKQASFPPSIYATADLVLASSIQEASLSVAVADTEKVRRPAGLITSSTENLIIAAQATITSSTPAPPVRMNLNWASAAQLQRIKGIGPRLAERIITYRSENGPFASVEDAINVSGIGQKKLEKMRLMLFVEAPSEENIRADTIQAETTTN